MHAHSLTPDMAAETTRTARCPSCDCSGEFVYAGEQRWPEKVAKAAGLPVVMTLWHCGHCHSTISECELEF